MIDKVEAIAKSKDVIQKLAEIYDTVSFIDNQSPVDDIDSMYINSALYDIKQAINNMKEFLGGYEQ